MQEIEKSLQEIEKQCEDTKDWNLSFKVSLLLYRVADKLTQLSQKQNREEQERKE